MMRAPLTIWGNLIDRLRSDPQSQELRHEAKKDGKRPDKGGSEERSEQAPHSPIDDHHEQHLKRYSDAGEPMVPAEPYQRNTIIAPATPQ